MSTMFKPLMDLLNAWFYQSSQKNLEPILKPILGPWSNQQSDSRIFPSTQDPGCEWLITQVN